MGCCAWKSESTVCKDACGLWTSLLQEERENTKPGSNAREHGVFKGWVGRDDPMLRQERKPSFSDFHQQCLQFYNTCVSMNTTSQTPNANVFVLETSC